MLNRITIMGRLTRDPELRYTRNDTPVASFTLAVDRDTRDAEGGRATDFIDCVAWNKTGKFVDEYFRKGSMAVATGRLQIRDWQDDKGNKRRSAEVIVDSVYFGESKREDRRDEGRERYDERRGDSYGDRGDSRYGRRESRSDRRDRYDEDGYKRGMKPQFTEMDDDFDEGELPF